MRRVTIQGISLVALFFASWFALSKIDWMTILSVKEKTDKTEEKLGEIFWDLFRQAGEVVDDSLVLQSIDSILVKLCKANNIERKTIQLHILENSEVNAFALPGGHLILFSGLIVDTENSAELAGIIGHEMAHIQLNHVMQKLVREVGLSVLISMTTGKGGPDVITETAKLLSSTAFDRQLEKEADLKAVDYLINAKVNPEPLANFLYRVSDYEPEELKNLSWIKTHPESKDRATYIIEYISGSIDEISSFDSLYTATQWHDIKKNLVEIPQ